METVTTSYHQLVEARKKTKPCNIQGMLSSANQRKLEDQICVQWAVVTWVGFLSWFNKLTCSLVTKADYCKWASWSAVPLDNILIKINMCLICFWGSSI